VPFSNFLMAKLIKVNKISNRHVCLNYAELAIVNFRDGRNFPFFKTRHHHLVSLFIFGTGLTDLVEAPIGRPM